MTPRRSRRRNPTAGVTVHRMRPPCADFPVYDNATYLLGYTWHVLGALGKLMETVKFDVLDFPE